MKYLSTSMATDWHEKEPRQSKVLKTILFFIPKANPGYEPKMHLVKKWLIEFEEEDGKLLPWREIGLDSNGTPVFAGPDKKNYGFWLDTNMEFKDFEGESIDKDEFERVWKITGVEAIKNDNES
ncbi:MAG: hypothetical protein HEP71_27050 [Roseivirga sp.]|nr:hypothetical protein [Roseivirga sp.]